MAERTDCPDPGRWQQFLHGSVPEQEMTQLDHHLESCELCQRALEGLVADQASWSDMARHLSNARPEIDAAQAGAQKGPHETRAADTDLESLESDQYSMSFLEPSKKPDSLGRLGHYEILEVVGRGGMGIVLRAFDDKLHRVVAIKVMALQLAATSPPRKRFLREARTAAAVRHEHVVDIHAVEEEPIPHLVMEYVPGENLQQKLDRVGPLEIPEVLRIGQQIARGLAAAHERGLTHRDIKPANILLESGVEPRVKITDFGLARAVDDASLTQSGMIAGTPMYMAPEQTQGETTDHRADLFSLGSVLYTMCSGRPPFRASTSLAVLRRVAEDTPRPIREIIPEVPQWLCDIIARLQAKKAADRFQTAQEVADLLGRCLAELQQQGQVISVGQAAGVTEKPLHPRKAQSPARPQKQAGSWPRRKHRWRWAAAVVLLLLGGLSFTDATGVTSLRATVIRIFTGDGTLIVEVSDPGVKVTIEGDGGLVITGAGPHEVRLRPGSYKLQAAKDGKPVRLDQELVTITRGGKQVVRVAVETKGLADASAALPESDEIRRFEGQAGAIYWLAYSPRESIVAAACHDECIRLWDPDSGKLIRTLEGHTNLVSGVAFSRDGKQIVSVGFDGTVRLWDVPTGKELQRLETGAELHSVALSPDGTLALCGGAATIQLWDLKNRKRIPGFGDLPSTNVYRVAISPDGRTALSGGDGPAVRLWDMASGKELQQLPHRGTAIGFSSDGRRALSYGCLDDKTIQLWCWEQSKLVLTGRLRGHKSNLYGAVFSPNGRQVISSSADNTMRLWDVESGKELHRFTGHTEGPLRGLVFSPDGRYLVSGSLVDGSVRLWKVPEPGKYRKPEAEEMIKQESGIPDDAGVHFALGGFHAQRGEWKEAAAAYDRGLDLDPSDHERWCQAAALHAVARDVDGYRRTCRELVQRFGSSDHIVVVERTSKACFLLPNALSAADFERMQKQAERMVSGTEKRSLNPFLVLAKALADYRADRHADAVSGARVWVKQFFPIHEEGWHLDAANFAILAMAYHRLDQAEEAAAALVKAQTIMTKMPDPPGSDWHCWLIAQILCREAEAKLKKK